MSVKQFITAFIYDKRGRVISVGQNSYVKTHTLQALHAQKVGEPHKIFMHAEIAAIARCKDLTRAHRMFVTRFGRECCILATVVDLEAMRRYNTDTINNLVRTQRYEHNHSRSHPWGY